MQSILSNERECFVCKTPLNLHKHHIYEGGGRRAISEKYGCWVYLCAKHHNMSDEGVHFNKKLDLSLKKKCQRRWESMCRSREDFIKTFWRSYL